MKRISLHTVKKLSVFILWIVLGVWIVLFFSNTEASDKTLLYFKDEIKISNDNVQSLEETNAQLQEQINSNNLLITEEKNYVSCINIQVKRIINWESVESDFCTKAPGLK